MNNLEFARELHKTFIALGQDVRTADFLKMLLLLSISFWFVVT